MGLETKQNQNASVAFDDIRDYMKHSVTCPSGGAAATFDSSYDLHGIIDPPTCKVVPDEHILPADSTN